MRTTLDDRREAQGVSVHNVERLVVTWQHPETREVSPVGLLSWDGETYSFDYLKAAGDVPDFRLLLGFPELTEHYTSSELFPIFQERVLDPRRPDFERYVTDLRLDTREASPWEQLARSGGGSESDTLQIYPVPSFDGTGWIIRFLVNGIRHLATKSVDVHGAQKGSYSPADLEALLDSLEHGQPLRVFHEYSNAYSDTAILVLSLEDMPLGYVPNWLSKEILPMLDSDELHFFVDRVNAVSAGWHLRLLALLTIDKPSDYSFLEGDRWILASA
jgi:hypothetical protein